MASTTTTLNDLLPQIVAEALFQANETSIMRGLVRNYAIGSANGKTVTVPIYPNQSAAVVTEGNEVSNGSVSTSGVTLTVETVAVRTLLTDLVRQSSASNVVADVGRLFGEAIARKMDQDLLALFNSFTQGVGDVDTAMSAASIAQSVAKLRSNAVPADMLYCVVHPNIAYDLKANLTNTFVNPGSGVIQNRAMETGFVGTLFGVPVFESSNAVLSTAATAAAGDYVGGVFHRDALGLAMIGDINIETDRRASFIGDDLVASAHYGVGILQDSYGVKVIADSSIE